MGFDKNFKYRFLDDYSLTINYYLGKKTKIKILEQLKKSLMQNLLTGKAFIHY